MCHAIPVFNLDTKPSNFWNKLFPFVWRCLDNDCLHVSLQIAEPFLSRLKDETYKLLKQCEEGFQYTRDDRDYSVYTGSGGRLIPLRHSQLLTTYRPGGSENQNEGIEILASYIDTVNFIHWLRSSESTWVQKLRLHEIDFTEYCLKK